MSRRLPDLRYVLAAITLVACGVAFAQGRNDDASRDEWQNVPAIFEAMGIGPGSHVADVGAGSGFFTSRLAKHVGEGGRVFAIDIVAANVERLKELAGREKLGQVIAVLGAADNPRLEPGSIDAALIVNAYHEFRQHEQILGALGRALRPDGRLVIVEPIARSRRGESRERQERAHEIEPKYIVEDLRQAGFTVDAPVDPFVKRPEGDEMTLIVARPAPR